MNSSRACFGRIVQNNAGISETIFVFKKRELQRTEKRGISFGISGGERDHLQTRDPSSEMDPSSNSKPQFGTRKFLLVRPFASSIRDDAFERAGKFPPLRDLRDVIDVADGAGVRALKDASGITCDCLLSHSDRLVVFEYSIIINGDLPDHHNTYCRDWAE
jgi:hypothetical protein